MGLIADYLQRNREAEARKQYQGLLGNAPQFNTQPQAGPMMPDQARPDVTAQLEGTGQGFLGGQMSPAEFYGKAAAIPGYENMGAQGLLGLQTAKLSAAASGAALAETQNKNRFGYAKDLRKEHTALSSDFRKVSEAYGRVLASTNNPSPAGDLSLIFNYMKMLDPGSVVRESEFRTAEQAKAWLGNMDKEGKPIPNQIRTIIQKATEGTFLLPEQRADFINKSQALYASQEASQNRLDAQFKDLAIRYQLNPSNVLIDPRVKRTPPPPAGFK